MIIGTGIDITDIERINKIMKTNKRKFLEKILTKQEIKYIEMKNEKTETVAGIFSSKEAVSKMLGTGIGKINWKHIEVVHDYKGKPYIKLKENALKLANEKGIQNIHISITHEKKYCVVCAIGEKLTNDELIETKKSVVVKDLLKKRDKYSHKGMYGRIGIIAGSTGMTGACYLCSSSALRCGSGLVYSFVPKDLTNILSIKFTEVIVRPVEDKGKGHFIYDSLKDIKEYIKSLDVLAVGPGFGVDEERTKVVEEILKCFDKPVVLDADGLNCCSKSKNIKSILLNRKGSTVLTPHPGELSRLLNVSIKEIQENRIKYAKIVSQKFNVVTILKGADTVICTQKGKIYINPTGNPGMATAGSGDVLTGMITSFIGQGIEVEDASILGVYCHGLAGDLASIEKGQYGMIASDIVEKIPYAIKMLNE